MATPRRQGREVALQVLCAADANPDVGAPAALAPADFFSSRPRPKAISKAMAMNTKVSL